MRIVEARTRADLAAFIDFPYRHYRGDPCWVPPLRSSVWRQLRGHPFERYAQVRYFLAREGAEVKGRIAAILNRRYNDFHGASAGFFGYFECVESGPCAAALLDAAAAALRDWGCRSVLGPASPSSNAEFGLLIEGFERLPALIMPYNKRYYPALLERWGLAKAKDLLAYEVRETCLNQATLRLFERIAARHARVSVRQLDMGNFDRELDVVVRLYNEAWERNWGFSPMTEEELRFEAKELKSVIDPRVALFAEIEGRAVGFGLSVPDCNPALREAGGRLLPFGWLKLLWHGRRLGRLRTLLLGVAPDFRGKGLDGMLVGEIIKRGIAAGYHAAECSWILEDNVKMRRVIERLGGVVTQTYRVYERAL